MYRPSKRSRVAATERSDPISTRISDVSVETASSLVTKSIDLNFRSLSTCDRCRIRKHRCDQRLPTCANCEKAAVRCIGYDPLTKKQIPRSYVYYLEMRVVLLEEILDCHRINYPDANASVSGNTTMDDLGSTTDKPAVSNSSDIVVTLAEDQAENVQEQLNTILESSGMPAKDLPLGSSQGAEIVSGISFACLAFLSAHNSVAASSNSQRAAVLDRPFATNSHEYSKGLTPHPSRNVGLKLVDLYFQNSNPMYPILYRAEFLSLFDRAYASQPCTPRESYILYLVFAIGAGIHLTGDQTDSDTDTRKRSMEEPVKQQQPEEYYATGISYLDLFLRSSLRTESSLEELQAVLLLAAFALLRPAAPGLWYVVGVALRRAVDLGLYSDSISAPIFEDNQSSEQKELVKDFRRRLWWCAYSFDRIVSSSVHRPPSIPDSVITADFPSLVDDATSSPMRFIGDADANGSSYVHVSQHYFRLRMLQSEIFQVLQTGQAQRERSNRTTYPPCQFDLLSPFLQRFSDVGTWRDDMDRRLTDWIDTAPDQATSGVSFPVQYFELNYWQTIIMLYRQSSRASIPDVEFASDENGSWDLATSIEEKEQAFVKTAEAGQAAVRLYRELHLSHLVNYTYLDTHQLFVAANAFLSAIWLSAAVRQRLSVVDIDLTILAATSILNDLVEKCPQAEACKDALHKMSRATLKKCRLSRNTTTNGSTSRTMSQRLRTRRRNPVFQHLAPDEMAFNALPHAPQATNNEPAPHVHSQPLGSLLDSTTYAEPLLASDQATSSNAVNFDHANAEDALVNLDWNPGDLDFNQGAELDLFSTFFFGGDLPEP